MKKILFVTATFYPQNRISVLRIGQWVKYLSMKGYDVTVLTTKKYPFLGPFGLEMELPGVHVVEVDFLPFFLRKKINKKTNEKAKSKERSSEHHLLSYLKSITRKARGYIGSFFDLYDFWIEPAFHEAVKLQEKKEFDYIISSFSPPAVHIVSHKLKLQYPNIKWIADFRDLWAYNHIIKAKGVFEKIEKRKEKKTISNADALITVSAPLTKEMKKHYPLHKIFTIENGFDPDEFPHWKRNITTQPKLRNKLVISYLGTIYPKRRDPSILFQAVNELIEEKKITKRDIEINFYGNNKKELTDIIEKKKYNKFNIINIKGFVSREQSLKIQKESDLLLFLEWNDPSAKGVLTGKLFEYLVSGTPILALGISKENAAGEVIEKTQTGKLFLEKEELKKELLKIFLEKRIEFYNPNLKEIEKFSREKQVEKLIEILESV